VLVRRAVVGLRGFKLNPALLVYKAKDRQLIRIGTLPAAENVGSPSACRRRLSSVGSRVRGRDNAAELGRRYGVAKSSVLRRVRPAGQPVRHLR
jgi:hypothetical protein